MQNVEFISDFLLYTATHHSTKLEVSLHEDDASINAYAMCCIVFRVDDVIIGKASYCIYNGSLVRNTFSLAPFGVDCLHWMENKESPYMLSHMGDDEKEGPTCAEFVFRIKFIEHAPPEMIRFVWTFSTHKLVRIEIK